MGGLLAAHSANGGQQSQLAVDYLRSRMPMMTGKTNVRPVDGPAMANGDKHQAEDENDMTQKRMVLA
jgi:hypothetical protein